MASNVTIQAKMNKHEYPSLQIISSNIEKMMRIEGFDLIRKLLQAKLSWERILFSLDNSIFKTDERTYGSTGEAIIYPIHSPCDRDIDRVTILPDNIAVENVHETQQYGSETRIYLIENVPNRSGYCYLRVIEEGSLLSIPNTMLSLTKEIHGCKYFSSLAMKEMFKDIVTASNIPWNFVNSRRYVSNDPNMHVDELGQQGPATYFRFNFQFLNTSLTKYDSVCVVKCPKWPSSAFEWIDRPSRSGWPTQELKHKIAKEGILLAPVGCKQDPSQDIQWRYSFNEAEIQLVTSFNGTQAKCYALLKRIKSEFVKPWFDDDVITSYHLKTLMFWTIEEIDLQAWAPANLVECIFLVLKKLTQCIEDENCPSYFIPTENLFRERSTLDQKEAVLARMHNILSEGWLLLFRLPHFSMNYKIASTMDQNIVSIVDIVHNAFNSADWHHLFASQNELYKTKQYLAELDMYNIHETGKINAKFSEMITGLTTKIDSVRDERIKNVLKNVAARLCSSYGTQCLSYTRHTDSGISRMSSSNEVAGEIFIQISCWQNQVECLAKHANYAYMCGKFQSAISTAFHVLQRYLDLCVKALGTDFPINVHYYSLPEMVKDTLEIIFTHKFAQALDVIMSVYSISQVIFSKNEIYAIPGNVKVEMFVVKRDEDFKDALSALQCLVVDPYFYVTFLAFQAYYDMGNTKAAEKVLEIMESICSKRPNSRLSTSLNLIGDCYLRKGHIDKAMEKFNRSMKINHPINAAPWHIARLVWRKLLDRWSKTRDEDV
ncbi:hypothetical protein ACJMK2_013186 [Sinanodonta woodiana]|uniref:Mab-21-like HhH/H2TH-like domain-containing protein n=1 Tax=Sinanodonta woodiana TaxID=1069815 RepID=A0ABD3UXF5_SINWO